MHGSICLYVIVSRNVVRCAEMQYVLYVFSAHPDKAGSCAVKAIGHEANCLGHTLGLQWAMLATRAGVNKLLT